MNSELTWEAELYCKDSGLRKPALREFHEEPVSQRFEHFFTIEDMYVVIWTHCAQNKIYLIWFVVLLVNWFYCVSLVLVHCISMVRGYCKSWLSKCPTLHGRSANRDLFNWTYVLIGHMFLSSFNVLFGCNNQANWRNLLLLLLLLLDRVARQGHRVPPPQRSVLSPGRVSILVSHCPSLTDQTK